MTINPDIIKALKELKINPKDGIVYLLGLKFGYEASYVPMSLIASTNRTGIYSLDNFNSLQWNIPLFDGETVSAWDWVKTEYRNMFKDANPEKAGNGNDCVRRMKKLFSQYPEIRKEDVIGATKLYITNTDSRFIRMSHYFIEKGQGATKTNDILTWVDAYKELNIQPTVGSRNQMQ